MQRLLRRLIHHLRCYDSTVLCNRDVLKPLDLRRQCAPVFAHLLFEIPSLTMPQAPTEASSQPIKEATPTTRQRKPTKRITENGDPLARKRVKVCVRTSTQSSTGSTASLRTNTTRSKDSAAPTTPSSAPPHTKPHASTQAHAPEDADGAGDTLSESEPIEVSDSDDGSVVLIEDDDTELGECHVQLCTSLRTDPFMLAVWLSKDWDAPIYTFFKPTPAIEYIDHHKAHVFECAAHNCQGRSRFVRWYLDTGDVKSTSNLRRHAKGCWGEETMSAADDAQDAKSAREALGHNKKLDGSITAVFQRVGKGQVTYSHRQHTKIEAWYVHSVQT
jgi:hypothetical protein